MTSSPPPFDPGANKKQHFVQQAWQRNFAGTNGSVYARFGTGVEAHGMTKRHRQGKADVISVANTMTTDWTYTMFDERWRPSNDLESAISRDERTIAELFHEVDTSAVALTPQLRRHLCEALGFAACRTPAVMKRGHLRAKELAWSMIDVDDQVSPAAHAAKLERAHGVALTDKERASLCALDLETGMAGAAGVEGMSPQDPRLPEQEALKAAPMIADAIAAMRITLLDAPDGAHFVLSDAPLPENNLSHGFTVPLSSKLGVEARPADGREVETVLRVMATPAQMAAVNREQYDRRRDVVIGPTADLLDAL